MSDITTYTLNANTVPITHNIITLKDQNVQVSNLKGTTIDGTKDANVLGATFESSNKNIALVDAQGKITPIQAGDVTVTVKAGNAEKKIALKVVGEDRKLAEVKADKTNIGTVTGAQVKVNLTFKDQFGDPILTDLTAPEAVINADKATIATVADPNAATVNAQTGLAQAELTVNSHATNVGAGNLVIKDGDKTFLTIPVTVGSSDKVAVRKLELKDTAKDNKLDVVDSNDNKLQLVYNKYADGDLLIGAETNIKEDTTKTYKVVSSDTNVATVAVAIDGTITVTAVKDGAVTINVMEGSLVRASYNVTIVNNTPSIASVTFEKEPVISASTLTEGKYAFSNILKNTNIKLSSTDEAKVGLNAGNAVIYIDKNSNNEYNDGTDLKVGDVKFPSTVGAVTLASEASTLNVKVKAADPVDGIGTGSFVVTITGVDGNIVSTMPVDVKFKGAEEVATARAITAVEQYEALALDTDAHIKTALDSKAGTKEGATEAVNALKAGDVKTGLESRISTKDAAIVKAATVATVEVATVNVSKAHNSNATASVVAKNEAGVELNTALSGVTYKWTVEGVAQGTTATTVEATTGMLVLTNDTTKAVTATVTNASSGVDAGDNWTIKVVVTQGENVKNTTAIVTAQ